MLTLIRHGQSVWNAQGRMQGHAPIPLSELGHEQARRLAALVTTTHEADALYSSDLIRCRQTAAPLSEALGMAVQYDPRWREMDLGMWQGLTGHEREHFDPEVFARNQADYREDPLNTPFPEGESRGDVERRVRASLSDLLNTSDHHHILVVTHGGPVRAVLHLFGLWEIGNSLYVTNTSRTVFRVADGGHSAELVLLNDTSHLPDDMVT
jgi:broad specificity phosphatase PhoE